METSFKTGFAQISFAAQKIWVAQNYVRLWAQLTYHKYAIFTKSCFAFSIVTRCPNGE